MGVVGGCRGHLPRGHQSFRFSREDDLRTGLTQIIHSAGEPNLHSRQGLLLIQQLIDFVDTTREPHAITAHTEPRVGT